MRERITFVHGPQDPFDPTQLRVEKNGLRITALKAAREDRLTFAFQELPQEVELPNCDTCQRAYWIIALESAKTMS